MVLKRKLQDTHYYVANIICPNMWLISAATCCLCQIVLNRKLMRNFKSCVNFCVEAEQHKRNCVKWDLPVISATICGCLVSSSSLQLWNMNKQKKKKNLLLLLLVVLLPLLLNLSLPIQTRSTDLVQLILNRGCKCKCLVKVTSRTLHPFESTPVPIIHRSAGWAPEPGWIL
jgi:hypothetical protein